MIKLMMDISCQVDFFFKLWLFWGWKTNSDDNQANYWVSVQWRSKRHGIACTGKDMTKDAHGRGLSVVWQQYRARPRLFLLPSSSSFPEILLRLISFPSPHYSLFNLIWPPLLLLLHWLSLVGGQRWTRGRAIAVNHRCTWTPVTVLSVVRTFQKRTWENHLCFIFCSVKQLLEEI